MTADNILIADVKDDKYYILLYIDNTVVFYFYY